MTSVPPYTLWRSVRLSFQRFPWRNTGLEWIHSPSPLAHPLDNGSRVSLEVGIEASAARLGIDEAMYLRLMKPLIARWPDLLKEILAPLHWPSHPFTLARFGLMGVGPATLVARTLFRGPETRALFAGMAAHSILPLETPGSAAYGWVLTLAAHAVGWPIARGGSQKIADALVSYLQSLGGEAIPNAPVGSLDELEPGGPVLCDVTTPAISAHGGQPLTRFVLSKAGAISLRGRGVQSRLGAGLSHPLARCRLRALRGRAYRGDFRRK